MSPTCKNLLIDSSYEGTVTGFNCEAERRIAAVLLLVNGYSAVLPLGNLPGDTVEQQKEIDTWKVGEPLEARVVAILETEVTLAMNQCRCGATEGVTITVDPLGCEIRDNYTQDPMHQ